MHQTTPITETLLAATYDQNAHLGTLPFFQAIQKGQLAAESYVALLHSLVAVYDAFGAAVTHSGHPELRSLWARHLQKQPLLKHDLNVFVNLPQPVIPAAALSAHVLSERLGLRVARDPLSLLGAAYVLVTWNMGGVALCEQIARDFRLDGEHGVEYLASFERWGRSHWPDFVHEMNAIPLELETYQHVVEAAQETLNGIEQLFNVLHPLNDTPTSDLVGILNPVAGNHKIPADMREVQAAMRASNRAIQYMPYFELRYGRRGRDYAWSDAGWLVELASEDRDSYNHQVKWLAQLLSARGMPRWTLECQLVMLHEELVRSIPEKHDVYATIYAAALMLADDRRLHLSDDTLMALDREFYTYLGRVAVLAAELRLHDRVGGCR
ncbi:MAG: biliverdin-producing heme oxygenase [Oscillochloris sp.]|nr:biliverdin-producing heme oxygenase [Oscillochloris sp.]